MGLLLNRAKALTSTTGTGSVTPSTGVSPYQSWSAAGAVTGYSYDYLIEDSTAWEIGTGVYNGTTITRPGPGVDPNFASSTGSLLNLSGAATVACVANKATLFAAPPTVRASALTFPGNVSTFNVNWPAGTAAGDLVVLFIANGFAVTTPTGWFQFDSQAGSNMGGATFGKVMTSGDISTGHVAITLAGAFNSVVAIIAFIGGANGLLKHNAIRSTSGATSVIMAGTGLQLPSDYMLFFGANRANDTASCNLGTQLQQNTDATVSGCLYGMVAGPQSLPIVATMAFTSAGSGYYIAMMSIHGP